MNLKRVLGPCGRAPSPQPIHQDVARHRLVRAQKKYRQQRPLLLPTDVEQAAVNVGLDRPE